MMVSFDDMAKLTEGELPMCAFDTARTARPRVHALAAVPRNRVCVESPMHKKPVAVRYAWGDAPIAPLKDKSGLPAAPFRSDDCPGITDQTTWRARVAGAPGAVTAVAPHQVAP